MLALQCVKSIPAWIVLRIVGRRFPRLFTAPFALLRLREVDVPALPGPQWVRLRPHLSGICGSDLASITAAGSPFFAPLTSFPFTFGHEVVGTVTEVGSAVHTVSVGDRVVIEPALHCTIRGIKPPCAACQQGRTGNCVQVTRGDISAGVQTGYCRDTGGGWSGSLVAQERQLHRVPDAVSDEAAVMLEPFSCALHAVLSVANDPLALTATSQILILGCGTMGLAILAALRAVEAPGRIVVLAKHAHQQELARKLGADEVIAGGRTTYEALARRCGATLHQPEIGQPTVLGGFDLVFDCVGSPRSLDDALRFTRARGRTILVGMPAIPKTVDWTTIWFKELRVMGVYAYGLEDYHGERLSTFALALHFVAQGRVDLRPFVTHKFALADYRQAIHTALATGSTRSVKTVFDLTGEPT